MLYKNIPNATELVKLIEQHKLPNFPAWRAKVDHNPNGEGSPTWLWFGIDDDDGFLHTYFSDQDDINNVDYAWDKHWHTIYKGTFQLDSNPFQNIKPEVYKVGDTVEVLEVARKVGNYEYWFEKVEEMIGKRFCVENVCDDCDGVSYGLGGYYFPSYAVRKVVDFADLENPESEPELKPDEIIELNGKKYKLIEE
jgi:hypothetical protein